ncbi:hypothetical protein [Mycolicibacterium sp. CBMA 226]|uniref:hypothetical protein n=1 Tax=Mycolicibacterium sp. CBMA 226 TaxID=2606611 RepID=UPI0012DCCA90|nr:hypothetical protein [Mycolicibacterium sp. CBMA 226]MUL75549.1 hypothetical protein [Mycolicibacterium sp. CBMA 226]
MQLTMRPYVTAGVALAGASVIAVAPVMPAQALHAPTLPQVHAPAVQLTALDNPLDVFAPIVAAVQQLLGDTGNAVVTNVNPLLRQVVINQLYTLQQAQQLIGNIAGGLGTIGAALPSTFQAVGAQLATGNVNGAIDAFQSGIIMGGLQLITGISQPIQNIVQRPLAVASALVPAMITTVQSLVIFAVGSTLGIGCSDCVTVKPIVQQVVSSIQSVLQAVTTLNPLNVINAVQHGIADVTVDVIKQVDQFVTDAVPFIASTIQTALNVNPNTPTGTTDPATATTAAAVKVSALSATAPKATDPAAVPAVTPADSTPAAAAATGTATGTPAGTGSPSTAKDDAQASTTKAGAAEPTSATTPSSSGSSSSTTSSGSSGSSTKDAGSNATGSGATKSGSDSAGASQSGSAHNAGGSATGAEGSTGGTTAGAGASGSTKSGDAKSGSTKSGDAKSGSTKSGEAKSDSSKSGDSGAGTATTPKAAKADKPSHAAAGASGGHAGTE